MAVGAGGGAHGSLDTGDAAASELIERICRAPGLRRVWNAVRGGSLPVFCASASQFGCQGVDVAKASEAWGVGGMLVRRIFSKRCFALSPGCSVPNFSWKDVLVAGRFITSRIGTVGLSTSYSTKKPLTLSISFSLA